MSVIMLWILKTERSIQNDDQKKNGSRALFLAEDLLRATILLLLVYNCHVSLIYRRRTLKSSACNL